MKINQAFSCHAINAWKSWTTSQLFHYSNHFTSVTFMPSFNKLHSLKKFTKSMEHSHVFNPPSYFPWITSWWDMMASDNTELSCCAISNCTSPTCRLYNLGLHGATCPIICKSSFYGQESNTLLYILVQILWLESDLIVFRVSFDMNLLKSTVSSLASCSKLNLNIF